MPWQLRTRGGAHEAVRGNQDHRHHARAGRAVRGVSARLLGADVIKVEHPRDYDQSRDSGSDRALNKQKMGTGYLTQGSNKRAITLNLKTEKGREILKQLVRDADVLVENWRSGSFPALGLGYEDLRPLNPKLIFCSMTAFGQDGRAASRPPTTS